MKLSDNEIERLQKIAEARKRQFDKQNQWQKEHYKRCSVLIPLDIFEQIINKHGNIVINKYLNDLVKKDLEI